MRALITGTSGAGKTTFARQLAGASGVTHIELDALNWQPGWVGLNQADPAEFARRVKAAIANDSWVVDGNYGGVRDAVWDRATDVIWLDYGRSVIMRRVVWRSIRRALDQRELWSGTGNRESWRRWLDREHPIRWAWDTWARRRRDYAERCQNPRFGHLRIHRLRNPREADQLVARLATQKHGVIPVFRVSRKPG